ncbi:cation:proton antiporter [Haliangium sp.]|uniref:cation:proton antiporter domain-containing protein n=1 Tax=Haliangium sp. TaxID=2663208 RepID=UPI003D13D95E
MHAPASFVADLAVVLMVGAVIGLLFRRLRQPTVLGYLFAGLLIGPYIPLPVFADPERVHALSEFGVVLVLFAVGLELRIARLFEVLPVSGATGVIQIGALLWAGFTLATVLGWGTVEALFLGGCVAISSTMLVTKVFEQIPVEPAVRGHVFGVLVLQDIAAIALIAVFTALAAGQGVSAGAVAFTIVKLGAVLILMIVLGLFAVPRYVRAVVRTGSSELLVVVIAGTCFGFALLAEAIGYSEALGAFVAGVLVAESGESELIEHIMKPLKDVFAAVFFVAIGMSIDPRLVFDHLGTSLLVVAVVIVGQFLSVGAAGLLSGNGLRRSILAGLALGQIGEFGFVIAAIGTSAEVVPDALAAVVVTVAVVTAFTTPLLLSRGDRIVHLVDHYLPDRLQTLLVLHEAWFERLRGNSRGATDRAEASKFRRALRAVVLDSAGIVAVAVATVVGYDDLAAVLARAGLRDPYAHWAVIAAAVVVGGPLATGLVRSTRVVGALLGESVVARTGDPSGQQRAELMRRLVALAVQLTVLLAVGVPAAAILRPFLRGPYAAPVLGLAGLVAAWYLWRTAGRVDAQVRSGAQDVVALLARQSAPSAHRTRSHSPLPGGDHASDDRPGAKTLAAAFSLIPGFDEVERQSLPDDAHAVGRTLAAIDLRARTGATVVAIHHRVGNDVSIPTGHERLAAGDILALAGPHEAIERARRFLLTGTTDAVSGDDGAGNEQSGAEPRSEQSGDGAAVT